MSLGIDFTEDESPDWPTVKAAGCAFAYVRFSYGVERERYVQSQVAAIRAHGIAVGGYHFFRPGQSPRVQEAAFALVAAFVGYGVGDLVPAVFVEFDPRPAPGREVSRDWWPPLAEFVEAMERRFGGCVICIGADDWWAMGSPAWVLDYPLWVPRYASRHALTTVGGREPLIWRRRFGTFDPHGEARSEREPGALGHNQAFGEIPICSRAMTAIT